VRQVGYLKRIWSYTILLP